MPGREVEEDGGRNDAWRPGVPRRRVVGTAAVVAAFWLAACGRGPAEEGAASVADPAAGTPGVVLDGAVASDADPDRAGADADDDPGPPRPAEVHYDLTAFDWYRNGEPLMHDDRAYRPVGPPVRTPDRPLRFAGRYGGVTYYAAADDPDGLEALYVPVFEDYWLRFLPTKTNAGS